MKTSRRVARDLLPAVHSAVQRGDRDQGVDPHLEVVAPPGEVVRDAHFVARPGEMQCGRPAQYPSPPRTRTRI